MHSLCNNRFRGHLQSKGRRKTPGWALSNYSELDASTLELKDFDAQGTVCAFRAQGHLPSQKGEKYLLRNLNKMNKA